MSFHFYRTKKLASEEELLRKKLEIENQICKQREKKRHTKSIEGQKYSRMFAPVTKYLEEIKALQKPDTLTENIIDYYDYEVAPEIEEEAKKKHVINFKKFMTVYHKVKEIMVCLV